MGEISFCLPNDGVRRKESRDWDGRSCRVIKQPFRRRQRVVAELMGLSAYSAQQISSAARFDMALNRLPPPAFTAYGLQSIIQHIAHFPMGSGAGC